MTRFTSDHAALALRAALGVLFFAHSLFKLVTLGMPVTVQFFASLGFQAPLAYAVVAAELVGGIALVVGAYVRPVAIVLAAVSFGAISAHAGNGWVFSNAGGGYEYPLFLGIVTLVQAMLGAGRFSIDARRMADRSARALAAA